MIGEKLRNYGFWTLDLLRKGQVRKHYIDIVRKMNSEIDSSIELSNLLKYVKENVPYYSSIKENDLSSFPVISKSDIVANYDAFQSKEYINTDLHWVSTSGSTGTPFKASQDFRKRNRTIADLIYFHKINGWNLGDRYIFLRAWTSNYAISGLKLFLQNFTAIDVVNFDDTAKKTIRQRLKRDKKIRVILGYASAIESFVNYLENKGDSADMFNLKVIFTCSDNLSDLAKLKIEKMFGCPVINRYSNEEHGVLACTLANKNIFRLNTASYYFELLKLDRDEPVEPGEIGRIIVTDLYNHSMPFIRYDTGDLAISDDTDRENLKTLSSLQGRVADVIRGANGNMISAAMVNNYLHKFYEVKRYQLIQDDKNHYLLKIVCDKGIYTTENLINVCREFLGETANIDIEYVDEIPVESTGKYKTVVKI